MFYYFNNYLISKSRNCQESFWKILIFIVNFYVVMKIGVVGNLNSIIYTK